MKNSCKLSITLKLSYNRSCCGIEPIIFLILFLLPSVLLKITLPEVGSSTVAMIHKVVLFLKLFKPKIPKILLSKTSKEVLSTALFFY